MLITALFIKVLALETTQMPINNRMDKETVMYSCGRVQKIKFQMVQQFKGNRQNCECPTRKN